MFISSSYANTCKNSTTSIHLPNKIPQQIAGHLLSKRVTQKVFGSLNRRTSFTIHTHKAQLTASETTHIFGPRGINRPPQQCGANYFKFLISVSLRNYFLIWEPFELYCKKKASKTIDKGWKKLEVKLRNTQQ